MSWSSTRLLLFLLLLLLARSAGAEEALAEAAALRALAGTLEREGRMMEAAGTWACAHVLAPDSGALERAQGAYGRAGRPFDPPRGPPEKGLRDAAHAAYVAGAYEEAARRYALAYALRPRPKVLFNIGQALRKADRRHLALLFYERFLQADPGTPLRDETAGYLTELRPPPAAPPVPVPAHEAPALLAPPPPRPPTKPPLYRRPWLWATLAATVGTGAAVALGVALGARRDPDGVDTLRPSFAGAGP